MVSQVLIAAALEATGLNPAVIFKSGHAFVGVWLKDMTFSTVVESDVVELRKAIAAREFIAFETTLVTSRPPAGFDHAVENGRAQLSEAHEVDFDRAIDLSRARAAGIRPLASHRVATLEGNDPAPAAPALARQRRMIFPKSRGRSGFNSVTKAGVSLMIEERIEVGASPKNGLCPVAIS